MTAAPQIVRVDVLHVDEPLARGISERNFLVVFAGSFALCYGSSGEGATEAAAIADFIASVNRVCPNLNLVPAAVEVNRRLTISPIPSQGTADARHD